MGSTSYGILNGKRVDSDRLIYVELSVGDIAVFKHLLKGKGLYPVERRHYVIGTCLEKRLKAMTSFELK
jgi:hypothetical protein